MKSKVRLSAYSSIITIVIIGVLLFALAMTHGETSGFYVILALLITMLIGAGLYSPRMIETDNKEIRIHSPWKSHCIPLDRVKKVELFQPTMGAIRIWASGGFMGYWGLFREGGVGRYTAFYGKASQCFLVCLDKGEQYVLGCEDPEGMVACIRTLIGDKNKSERVS